MTGAGHSDEQLVYAVARGDREALASLYERHAGVMLAVAQRITPSGREAEDLVHDVFVEAWQRAGDFDPARGSVRTWLLLRLRSRALDRIRSVGQRRVQLVAEAPEQHAPELQSGSADGARVRAALLELTPDQLRVLELGYFHGLSSQEIAECLGVPIGTVKSRVAAALGQLRKRLGARMEGESP